MATETVSSNHHFATSEKEVQSEVEAETVAPPPPLKESVAPEESAAAPSTEPETKIEDKHVEPPPVNECAEDDTKTKSEGSVDAATTIVAEAINRKTEDIDGKEVELPPKTEEMKTEDVTEAECKVEEVSPASPTVEEKPSEESRVIEAEPVGLVEVKTQTLLREEESGATENTTTRVEEKEVECHPTEEGGEKTGEEKEPPSKETIELKEKVSEPQKIEAKTDENSVITEEKIKCELKGEVVEEEVTDKDTKPVAENAETEADHKEASEETDIVEVKIKETAQASNEPVENPECTKEIEDTKKPEDVPVKTQKQSIVKMVKQSLVKAKKAITGKSPNPKTPASEPKDDGNK